MREAQLRQRVAADTGLTPFDVGRVIRSLTDTILTETRCGPVVIPGLGKFFLRERPAKSAVRCPDGQIRPVEARSKLAFHASIRPPKGTTLDV